MKVYGFTDEGILVPVEMSIERICATGIDPWVVDLLDSQPLKLEVDGKVLNFKRLSYVAFAYERHRDDPHTMICRHDHEAAICVIGERLTEVDATGQYLEIRNVRLSELTFVEHMAEYLRLSESTPLLTEPPRTSLALKVQGDRVMLDLWQVALPERKLAPYCGEMFEEATVAIFLDERINWVFERLGPFNPVVCAEAFIGSIACGSLKQVDVALDEAALNVISDELGAFPKGRWLELERQGCLYRFRQRLCPVWRAVTEDTLQEAVTIAFLNDEEHDRDWFSLDNLYSVRRNEICGPRIAIYDLAQKQFRSLLPRRDDKKQCRNSRAEHYQELGLTRITLEQAAP